MNTTLKTMINSTNIELNKGIELSQCSSGRGLDEVTKEKCQETNDNIEYEEEETNDNKEYEEEETNDNKEYEEDLHSTETKLFINSKETDVNTKIILNNKLCLRLKESCEEDINEIKAQSVVSLKDLHKSSNNIHDINFDNQEEQHKPIASGHKSSNNIHDIIFDNKEEQHKPIAPDGGWSWMVIIGIFVIFVLCQLMAPSFGVLFSTIIRDLKISSITVAWIFNIQIFFFFTVLVTAGPLSEEFGWRIVGIIGSAICSLSFILSAFATSAAYIFFSYSFLSGVGGSLAFTVCYYILPHYWDRRRGMATAIGMTGICLGKFIAPLAISKLLESYGYFGSMLIIGGFILNGCVAAALFQPIQWHSKFINQSSKQRLYLKEVETGKDKQDASLISVEINDAKTGNLKKKNKRKCTEVCGRISDVIIRVSKATKNHVCILKSPKALIITLGQMFTCTAYFNFEMLVPLTLLDQGYTLQDGAWCLSIEAITSGLARFILSFLSDHNWFNKAGFYVLGAFILSVTSFGFTLINNLTWYLIIMGIRGLGNGAIMSLYSLVIIDYMSLKDFPATFGSGGLLLGIGSLIIGPLTGLVRDWSRSYFVCMWVLGAISLTTCFLWMLMPTITKYEAKKNLSSHK